MFDPLELESQAVVSHHVGARGQAQILCKGSQLLTSILLPQIPQRQGLTSTHTP